MMALGLSVHEPDGLDRSPPRWREARCRARRGPQSVPCLGARAASRPFRRRGLPAVLGPRHARYPSVPTIPTCIPTAHDSYKRFLEADFVVQAKSGEGVRGVARQHGAEWPTQRQESLRRESAGDHERTSRRRCRDWPFGNVSRFLSPPTPTCKDWLFDLCFFVRFCARVAARNGIGHCRRDSPSLLTLGLRLRSSFVLRRSISRESS
jgi:hypothetical protein